MPRHEFEHRFAASPEDLWPVVVDIAAAAEALPHLSGAEILSGEGSVGRVSRCTNLKGQSWTETCFLWEEGRAFGTRADAHAADYPYPLEKLELTYHLTPRDGGTTVRMSFDYRMKYGLFGRLLELAIGKRSFRKISADSFQDLRSRVAKASGAAAIDQRNSS